LNTLQRQSNQFQIFKSFVTRVLKQALTNSIVGASGGELIAYTLVELSG
jgi:hypothetical protein